MRQPAVSGSTTSTTLTNSRFIAARPNRRRPHLQPGSEPVVTALYGEGMWKNLPDGLVRQKEDRAEVRRERKKRDNLSPVNVLFTKFQYIRKLHIKQYFYWQHDTDCRHMNSPTTYPVTVSQRQEKNAQYSQKAGSLRELLIRSSLKRPATVLIPI